MSHSCSNQYLTSAPALVQGIGSTSAATQNFNEDIKIRMSKLSNFDNVIPRLNELEMFSEDKCVELRAWARYNDSVARRVPRIYEYNNRDNNPTTSWFGPLSHKIISCSLYEFIWKHCFTELIEWFEDELRVSETPSQPPSNIAVLMAFDIVVPPLEDTTIVQMNSSSNKDFQTADLEDNSVNDYLDSLEEDENVLLMNRLNSIALVNEQDMSDVPNVSPTVINEAIIRCQRDIKPITEALRDRNRQITSSKDTYLIKEKQRCVSDIKAANDRFERLMQLENELNSHIPDSTNIQMRQEGPDFVPPVAEPIPVHREPIPVNHIIDEADDLNDDLLGVGDFNPGLANFYWTVFYSTKILIFPIIITIQVICFMIGFTYCIVDKCRQGARFPAYVVRTMGIGAVQHIMNNRPFYTKVLRIADNSLKFVTDNATTLSDEAKVLYTEVYACVNIVYSMTGGDYIVAGRFAFIFGITRAELVKELIEYISVNVTKLRTKPIYSILHKRVTHRCSLTRFNEYAHLHKAHPRGIPDGVMDDFIDSLARDNIPQAGGDIDFSNYIKPIIKIITSLSSGALTERDIQNANARFQYMNHQAQFQADQAVVIKNIISLISLSLFNTDPCEPASRAYYTELLMIVDFVEKNYKYKNFMQTNEDLMKSIVKVRDEARICVKDPRFTLGTDYLRTEFTKRYRQLEELGLEADLNLGNSFVRNTPVAILFTGQPGSGKTTVMDFLIDSLSEVYGFFKGPLSLYTYNFLNKHHEGYAKQPFVYVDDIFKSSEIADRRMEAMFFVSAVNSAPYNMEMAFESKGKVWFDSSFIFSSTNYLETDWDHQSWEIGLKNPKAFLRRLHLVLHRDEPVDISGAECNEFLVTSCLFPEFVGRKVRAPEILEILMMLRKHFEDAKNNVHYTDEEIREIFPNIDALRRKYFTQKDRLRMPIAHAVEPEETTILDTTVVEFDNGTQKAQFDEACGQHPESREEILLAYYDALKENPFSEEFINEVFECDTEDPNVVEAINDYYADKLEKTLRRIRNKPKVVKNYSSLSSFLSRMIELKTGFMAEVTDGDPAILQRAKWLIAVAAILTAMATATSVWYFWYSNVLQGKKSGATGENRDFKVRFKHEDQPRMKRKLREIVVRDTTTPQSNDSNYYLSLINNVSCCCINVDGKAYDEDSQTEIPGSRCSIKGFHYKDGIVFIPAHFVVRFESYVNAVVWVQITWKKMDEPLIMKLPCGRQFEGEDIYFFQIPKVKHFPKSLCKYMWCQDDMKPISCGTAMSLVQLNDDLQVNVKNLTKAKDTVEKPYPAYGAMFCVDYCLNYWEETVEGDCGSLIAIQGSQGQAVVMGFHVCRAVREHGSITFGFAATMSRDSIEPFIEECYPDRTLTQSRICSIPFPIIETVPDNMMHVPPTRTRISRSDLYGWDGPPVEIPAHLSSFTNSNGEEINPLELAMKKLRAHHTPPTEVPDDCQDFLAYHYPRPLTRTPRVLTIEEAVQGIPGTDITSINMSTSPGYPGNKRKMKGKSAFIDVEGDKFTCTPEFHAHLCECMEILKSGNPISVVFADALKDETRPRGKVELGKTRLFSGSPIDYLILMRMCFGDFFAYMKGFASEKPVAVGVNCHSPEWTNMVKMLEMFEGSILAGDFENWDGSVPQFLFYIVINFINWWYNDGPVMAQVRLMLASFAIESKHILYNWIYQVMGSLPSGMFGTSEFNSLIQMLVFYIVLKKDFGIPASAWFGFFYGDDGILKIPLPNLACSDLAPFIWDRFQMKYTHSSKSTERIVDTIETAKFIARSFVKDENGIYKAPLAMRTIVEMLYWKRGAVDGDTQLLETALSFFANLAHYPKPVFDEYSDKVMKVVQHRLPHLVKGFLSKKLMYSEYQERMYYSKNARANGDFNIPQMSTNGKDFVVNNLETTARAVKEESITERTVLGNYDDVGPISGSSIDPVIISSPHENTNMETINFNRQLDRSFVVPSGSAVGWGSGVGVGGILTTIYLPGDILNKPFMVEKTNGYRYLKAGVEITVRCDTAKTNYGKLLVAYSPLGSYYPIGEPGLVTPTPLSSIYLASGGQHVLVDASAGENVSMTIPFVSPFKQLDLAKYGSKEMGIVQVYVLNSLLNSVTNVSASASVTVTARFVDAQVWLPFDSDTGFGSSLAARKAEKVGSREEYMRLLTEDSGDQTFIQMKGSEAIKKATNISSRFDSFVPTRATVQAVKLFSGIAAKAITHSILGLSKPTITNAGAVVCPNSNYNVNSGNGVDSSSKVALDVDNGISTEPNVAGISEDEMKISYIAQTPTLVNIVTLTASPSPTTTLCSVGIETTHPGYGDYLKQMHAFWSGSTKVKLYITASLNHVLKLVFFLTSSPLGNWEDCASVVVDVQGSVEVDFMLPYCEQAMTQFTVYGASTSPMKLCVKILNWCQSDNSLSNPIYINVYKAMASDFELGAPMDVRYIVQCNPRDDFKRDFTPLQASFTGYEQKNFVLGEKIDTLRLLVHRPQAQNQISSGGVQVPFIETSRVTGQVLCGLDLIAMFYRFWRGSIRMKFFHKKNAIGYGTVMQNFIPVTSAAIGMQGIGLGCITTNTVEAEFPYYSSVLFDQTSQVPFLKRTATKTGLDANYLMKSGGDDFSFHWLQLPPAGAFEDNNVNGGSSAYGYKGMQNFFG